MDSSLDVVDSLTPFLFILCKAWLSVEPDGQHAARSEQLDQAGEGLLSVHQRYAFAKRGWICSDMTIGSH